MQANQALSPKDSIEVKSKIKRIAGRKFELTAICDGCYTLKSVKTGKVSTFTSLPLRSRRSFQQPTKYRLVGTVRF